MVTEENFSPGSTASSSRARPSASRPRSRPTPSLRPRPSSIARCRRASRGAFDAVAERGRAPMRSSAAARSAEVGRDRSCRRPRDASRGGGRRCRNGPHLAATLAVGIVAGTMVPGRSERPVELHERQGLCRGRARRGARYAARQRAGGDVRIGLTFRDQLRRDLPNFTEAAASGLACREPRAVAGARSCSRLRRARRAVSHGRRRRPDSPSLVARRPWPGTRSTRHGKRKRATKTGASSSGEGWCPGAGSNHRHRDFQSRALPTELPGLSRSGRAARRSERAP